MSLEHSVVVDDRVAQAPGAPGLPKLAEIDALGLPLFAHCNECHVHGPVNVPRLIRRGLGDRSPGDIQWLCSECGSSRISFRTLP